MTSRLVEDSSLSNWLQENSDGVFGTHISLDLYRRELSSVMLPIVLDE